MKATLSYNLNDPDDRMAHLRAVKSMDMASALFDITRNLKNKIENRYEDIDNTHNDVFDGIDAVFDEFMTWGNILLSDFDEMERYMIDSNYLFRNLKDIKEIENWSFGEGMQLSERQKRFMEFWDRLPGYYKEFNARLLAKNATYSGKSYRELSENIDRVFAKNVNAHFLFCGFNCYVGI